MLISSAADTPDMSIRELPIMDDAERHKVTMEWNDTAVPFPSVKCAHELFEEQAMRTPDN